MTFLKLFETTRSEMTIFLLLLCCVLIRGGQAESDHHYNGGRGHSRTYADFLHRASLAVQHANNTEHIHQVKSLNDRIYQLYLPSDIFIKNQFGLNTDSFNSSYFKSKLNEQQEEEEVPLLLRTILDSLQEVAKDVRTTSACINDTGSLIISLMKGASWAFQFFDAMGKPGPSLTRYHLNFVGNYDQCRAAVGVTTDPGTRTEQYRGNYCAVGLYTFNNLMKLEIGTCLPSTCSSLDVTILTRNIAKRLSPKIPEQLVYGQCLTAPTEVTTATVFAILILSIIGALMILGTIFDLIVAKNGNQITNLHVNKPLETSNGYESLSNSDGRDQPQAYSETSPLTSTAFTNQPSVAKSHGVLAKVLTAFSVYTNGKKLLNTSHTSGTLGAVHGIRFLSMSWVVLCHVFAFIISFTLNSGDWAPSWLHRWTSLPISNGYTSVDTFFTLSGLLTSYLTIKEMMHRQTWKLNWPMIYFHRFWRLTPPYMFAIVIVLGLNQYMGQGPMWENLQPGDKKACETNWWTNLLYVNNLVGTDLSCFGHAWYLANDMQFFILSPILLIPFYFHRLAGMASCLLMLLVHMVTTGVLSNVHELPTTTTSLKPVPGRALQPEWFNNYYIVPWCRIGPFIVGVMAGYVLAVTKGRQFRMPWWVVTLGWSVSIASGMAVVYGIRGDITGDNPSSLATAALYNAVSRSVWGACVSWVIIACSAGYGGPVNALLSWSPFVFLGRLTYMCYLIHLAIGSTFFQDFGTLLYVNDTMIVLIYLGILTVANMVAFVLVLALESPMLGLERAFLRRERQ